MTFGGRPDRWEPDAPSAGVALLAPGRSYPPSASLLDLSRLALLQHGFTVQELWWDSTTRREEDPEAWVRRHVAAAHAAEAERDADRVLVVGKSLGTRAASYAAEHGLDAVWLTPLLDDPATVAALAANPGRQLLVGGLADPYWDSDVARRLAAAGCAVCELPDGDHGLGTPDAVRTAELHLEVARAVSAFVAGLAGREG